MQLKMNATLDSIKAFEQLLIVPIVEFNQIPATVASVVAAKKRGRPPGAKNKPKSPSSVNYLTKKNSPKKKKRKMFERSFKLIKLFI